MGSAAGMHRNLLEKVHLKSNQPWNPGLILNKDLIALEKMGATHISIEPYETFGEVDVHIEAEARRLETDKEYNERILEDQERELIHKQYEIRTFNKIKAKYNL